MSVCVCGGGGLVWGDLRERNSITLVHKEVGEALRSIEGGENVIIIHCRI